MASQLKSGLFVVRAGAVSPSRGLVRSPGLAALVFLVSVLAGCQSSETVSFSGPIMGTSFSVKLPAGNNRPYVPALRGRVVARLEELNARLSTWLEDSEVSRFNRSTSTGWFPVSADTARVVARSLEISVASRGAFDVTVGPVVDLWGFGPTEVAPAPPPATQLERLRASAGHEQLEARLTPPALRKRVPELRIDLSAIAKGYAVDEIARVLEAEGLFDYMVEIGGEIRTGGRRTGGDPWRIALERPQAGTRVVLRVLELSGESVASSGDYRNFFEIDGRRYSHAIDPRTGWPVTHALGGASVVATECMTADAWATALMVLGPEAGLEAAREAGIAANLVERSGGEFVEHMTPAFRELLR